ncbi:MAG TPA: polysaccharide deacetylase [Candidatus Limnocylindrales bacterium]|nr:polysaccharide deacetylase [Candidatus Limnocylindrales bacterium]
MSAAAPAEFRWPDGRRAAACFTFDVDAESPVLFDHPEAAGWLDVMTHQAYGPRTGVPRLLRLLDAAAIRATFFVPGWVAERWPGTIRSIRDAGHEIGHHGYLHESSRGVTAELEEERLLRGLEALDAVAGVRPVGYRAPMWEASVGLPRILARHGFGYDSSLMDADRPYRLAVDHSSPDGPSIVELPIHWALDDWEAYAYLPGITGSGWIASPAELLERWTLELEALAADGGLFLLTNHPFLSGRASRAAALATLVDRARAMDGVWIATCEEIAEWTASLGLPAVVHRPALPPG